MGLERVEAAHKNLEQSLPGTALAGAGLLAGQHRRIDPAREAAQDRRLRGKDRMDLGQRQLGRLGDIGERQAAPATLGRQRHRGVDHLVWNVGFLLGHNCLAGAILAPIAALGEARKITLA